MTDQKLTPEEMAKVPPEAPPLIVDGLDPYVQIVNEAPVPAEEV